MTYREQLLIDLINCEEISKTEMKIAVFCRTRKSQQNIMDRFGMNKSNVSRHCSRLVKLLILEVEEEKGETKKYRLNENWTPDIVEGQLQMSIIQ